MKLFLFHHPPEFIEINPSVIIGVHGSHNFHSLLLTPHQINNIRHEYVILIRFLKMLKHHAKIVLFHDKTLIQHGGNEVSPVERVLA